MGEASWPMAIYLQDARYGLRAPVPEDAAHAGAWYEGGFPLAPHAAERLLAESETVPWGHNPMVRLMVVDLSSGEIIGGALVERQDNRVGKLVVTAGGPGRADENAQRLRADVLRLLLPWVMGELNLMTAVIDVPADEAIVIDAARELGLVEVARLREHIARPAGRVDLVMLERVNRAWGRGDA